MIQRLIYNLFTDIAYNDSIRISETTNFPVNLIIVKIIIIFSHSYPPVSDAKLLIARNICNRPTSGMASSGLLSAYVAPDMRCMIFLLFRSVRRKFLISCNYSYHLRLILSPYKYFHNCHLCL